MRITTEGAQARFTMLVMGLLQGRLAGRPAQKLTLPSTIILIISVLCGA